MDKIRDMPGPRLWKRYNGVYYVVLPGDSRITLKTRDKEEASKLFHKFRRNWLAGKIAVIDGAKNVRLGDFQKEYLKAREGKARSTRRNDKVALGHLVAFFGVDRTMRSITVRELEQFKAGLLKGVEPITVNAYLRHLRTAFATALRWEYLLKNPMRLVAFETEPERESMPVIAEVLVGILAQADEEEARAVRLALYTGLRPFELVRLEYGTNVVGDVIRVLGKRQRRREVPILGDCAGLIGAGVPGERVLKRWTTPGGLSHMFRRLANDAGYPNVRLYDLRHTFGTVMTLAGVDPFHVSKLMGHTDIKTTQRYVSVTHQHLEAFMEKAGAFYDKSLTAGRKAIASIGKESGKGKGTASS
ncbi:MAG: tyrosine-type recombinase/integrase [Deltaproteobacteria bacterium]|nr:tyrosine-type recombinase/integrase [Deltaproteobacteria bacterium]MDA8178335.1 tyrosine-type recombinase/integrase [Deltaproteobacteria bacterium]